jgi:subtilase family serine protease
MTTRARRGVYGACRVAISLGLAMLGAAIPAAAAQGPSRDKTVVALRGRNGTGLSALLAAQQDPASPHFRRWLTPREFGRRFGTAPRDLRRVERWMRGQGCRVKRFPGRQQVACVGTTPGSAPPSLGRLVDDVLDPETLDLRFNLTPPAAVTSSLLQGTNFYFSPREYAGFYGFDDLQAAGIDGRGQTIGIVGFARVSPSDADGFRRRFDLPPPDLEQVGETGVVGQRNDAQLEAVLDVTWAGAVAPGARVVLALSSGRLVDALAYLVNRADVDVLSLSVVLVPSPRSNPLIREALRLFRQASAQGQTVLIASGDYGSLITTGPQPRRRRGVDPFGKSPFVTAVGGTIPVVNDPARADVYGGETVWRDGETASGGGHSKLVRPAWQRGSATRTVPDVSLAASSVYPLPLNGRLVCCVGGTSAGAPAWAGLVAMLNQQRGVRSGLLNPVLYELGRAQARGGPAVFHDIVAGSSTTTLARGFRAKPGYDLATGWGSPDVGALFDAYP